jgi:drug/metabolite transporter (DMT)-like permease
MELWHVIAALISAVLHAGWNAAVKSAPRPAEMLTAQITVAALLVMPGLLWTGLPPLAAWKWIALSTTLSLVVNVAILKAYALAGFGASYPIIRAVSVMLMVPLTAWVLGETLSPYGLAGVGLVATSLLLLMHANRGQGAVPPAALFWIMLTGAVLAVSVLCDAQGVRAAGSPWSYGFTTSITNAAIMLIRQKRQGQEPLQLLAQYWRAALPVAMASVTSYLLILLVWSSAPIAPAAALRDTSAVIAILIAVFWLKEPMTLARIFAVTLAAAAVPLLRFA